MAGTIGTIIGFGVLALFIWGQFRVVLQRKYPRNDQSHVIAQSHTASGEESGPSGPPHIG